MPSPVKTCNSVLSSPKGTRSTRPAARSRASARAIVAGATPQRTSISRALKKGYVASCRRILSSTGFLGRWAGTLVNDAIVVLTSR